MRKLFLFVLLISVLYLAKPIWEEPVSKYVDISFLDPVDEKIQSYLNKESVSTVVQYIGETTDKALHLLSSKLSENETTNVDVKKPVLSKPEHSQFSIHNIEIGTTEKDVLAKLGEPKSQSMNEYGTEWYTFHTEYSNFIMVSFDKNRLVNALYTNDDLIASSTNIRYGSPKSLVRELLGEPLKEIRKGLNIFILQDSEGFDFFQIGDTYTYVFYDLHQSDKVTAIQLVSKSLELQKASIYAGRSSILQHGFEQQLFNLTNASRVRNGLNSLKWEESVAGTARKHSKDMANNDFFSHDNKQGQSPFDRMEIDGIDFRGAGENLAYGQSSSIFAHEGLMNSAGHRENILLDTYNYLGVGVAFNETSQPYYTANFLQK